MVKTMGIFHKSFNQRIKHIEKNKKLSSNEKLDKIVELYRVYFYYIIHNIRKIFQETFIHFLQFIDLFCITLFTYFVKKLIHSQSLSETKGSHDVIIGVHE